MGNHSAREDAFYERQVDHRPGVIGSDDPLDSVADEMNANEKKEPLLDREFSRSNTRQVGGQHYGLGVRQHWDLVVEFDLDYFQGQITKYVMRWNKKNGLEDLKKAQHFLEKYIEEIEAGRIK